MAKSADAFRTISEVADWLETPAHVLRFWESKFSQVKPVKRAGGRRYYRPADMKLLGGIKKLLHDDGLTIKGVQKILREQGVKHVSDLSQPLGDAADDVVIDSGQDARTDAEAVPVLGFQRRTAEPEAPEAETEPPAAEPESPEPDADAAEEEPEPALPSFLHRREAAVARAAEEETGRADPAPDLAPQAEPPAPVRPQPARVEVPADPPDTIAAETGPLTRLVKLPRPISKAAAAQLSPLLAKLRAAAGTPRKD